jgi:DNA-binding CsgD family transcriptional regulator
VERLLRLVAEAESLGDDEQPFTSDLLVQLGGIVEADWVGYNELDCVRRRTLFFTLRPGDADDEPLEGDSWEIVKDHPVCMAHERGDFRTLKLSDFLTQRELHRTPLYNDWFRPSGVEYELELALPSPQWNTRTFIWDRRGRSSRDFGERDRLVLDLVKPHLARLSDSAAERRRAAANGHSELLTAREREVLSWVAKGKTNPQIAEVLWVSPATVRKHLENVYGKLGVSTRTAAVARFLGLADGQEPDAASVR